LLIPDIGELAFVAPVIVQVNLVTLQLSDVVGLLVAILAVQVPGSVNLLYPLKQLITGG